MHFKYLIIAINSIKLQYVLFPIYFLIIVFCGWILGYLNRIKHFLVGISETMQYIQAPQIPLKQVNHVTLHFRQGCHWSEE